MRKGDAIIRDPEMRRLRALMMLEYKLKNGASNAAVAKEFGVGERTVERTLSWMRRAGLVASAEDKILQELIPAAHKALLEALNDGNANSIEKAKLAIELFKGAVPSFGKKNVTGGPVTSSGGELESYIDQLRGELGGVIDGEVAEQAERALPAATSSVATQGIPAPDSAGTTGDGDSAERSAPVGTTEREGALGDSQQ